MILIDGCDYSPRRNFNDSLAYEKTNLVVLGPFWLEMTLIVIYKAAQPPSVSSLPWLPLPVTHKFCGASFLIHELEQGTRFGQSLEVEAAVETEEP